MRAERDEDDYAPVRYSKPERRLAYEIALGIWLGGIALGATSLVFWIGVMAMIAGRIKVG